MIRYALTCDNGHAFEGWFSSSEDFDRQSAGRLVACPFCDSTGIGKSLMTPGVATARSRDEKRKAVVDAAMDGERREALARLREAVSAIRAGSEDVGTRFPEEARRIHYGEVEMRGIIGQASLGEVRDLWEEGIEVAPLPDLPEDAN